MQTIQTNSKGQVDIQEILNGIAQLKVPDLEAFFKEVGKILEDKKTPEFLKKEKHLIEKIKGGPSEEFHKKYKDLLTKSVQKVMTEEENRVFLDMVKDSENWMVERLKYMIELANLWDTSVEDVMERLDIKPPNTIYA